MAPKRGRREKRKKSEKISKNEEQDLERDNDKFNGKEGIVPDSERNENVKTKRKQDEQTYIEDQDRDKNKSRKRKKSRSKSSESEREYDKKRKGKSRHDIGQSDSVDEKEGGCEEYTNQRNEEYDDNRQDTCQQENRLDNDSHIAYREKPHSERPLIVKTDEEVLMILTHPSEICLKGKCQLTSLCGRVTLLGYHVTPSVKPCDFYSPESNSLLTIKTIDTDTDNKVYNDICARYLDKKSKKRLPKQDNGVILQLKKLDSVMCDYVTKLSPFQQLFTVSEYISDNIDLVSSNVDVALIAGEVNLPRIKISEDFCYLADTFTNALDKESAPVVVVCGGKNSGKSTLNRFLINTALNKVDKIFYLECDVGQTEFTPPGCVSLHMVELPVIGPPFCHQRQPAYSCYFGGNSPADDPDYYIRCLQQCFRYYQQLVTKLPLIVNTMGWTKGLGLDLMVDTLQLINPDFVIQLDCYNQSLNFPALTPDYISEQNGWIAKSQILGGESTDDYDRNSHKLIIIESPVAQQEQYSIKLKALDHRNLSILGYLSQCIEPGMTLTSVPPYVVSWNAIGIHVIHEVVQRLQVMYALNGSIVALCDSNLSQAYRDDDNSPWWFKQAPDARCLGFGLVRGIDPENRKIYIITPLSPIQLKQVNTLIRGSTNVPEQVLLKQKSSGTLPYVDITTSSSGASSLRQRKHMPRKYNTDFRF